MPKVGTTRKGKTQTTNTAASKRKQAKKQADATDQRPVLYTEVTAKKYEGDNAISVDQMKEILGWTEATDDNKFGSDFLLKDLNGKKIRCVNNTTNRPFYQGLARTYTQEHLKRKWKLNGETFIIGETGMVLEGQHSGVALVLAGQAYDKEPDKYHEWWSELPTMEKIVVMGIKEDDETVNTINTGKPRSLTDVIYRSKLFQDIKPKDRKAVSKVADYAVRLLWHRTGASFDAFGTRRTHSESMEFIERHPKLLDCVKHVHSEDGKDKNISRYVSVGTAAGLLYLMGTSKSNQEEYYAVDHPNEESLDFSLMDKAQDFFVLLAAGAEEVKVIRTMLGKMIDDYEASFDERCALVIKAWLQYLKNGKLVAKGLKLKYHVDEDDIKTLEECPIVGGIDRGDPSEEDPMPEQIAKRATQERKRRQSGKKTKSQEQSEKVAETGGFDKGVVRKKRSQTGTKSKPDGTPFEQGDHAWVAEDDPEACWSGVINEIYEGVARILVDDGFAGAGEIYETPLDSLRREQPAAPAVATS